MKRHDPWHGYYGSCYRYETEEPGDQWHDWRESQGWWRKKKRRFAIHLYLLRKLGTKHGLCNWPPKWYEKPLRVLLYPWKSIKNQIYWITKGPWK